MPFRPLTPGWRRLSFPAGLFHEGPIAHTADPEIRQFHHKEIQTVTCASDIDIIRCIQKVVHEGRPQGEPHGTQECALDPSAEHGDAAVGEALDCCLSSTA
jgi:hypothetical protein